MRIAFVQAGLGAGGAEKVVNLLAQHRLAVGDSIHVIAFGRSNCSYFPYDESVEIDLPVGFVAAGSPRSVQLVQRLLWLRKKLKSIRPNIILSFLTKTNVLVMVASRGLGVPVILSERNNPLRQNAHPLWTVFGLRLAAGARRLVMQTDAAFDALPESLRNKAVVIPNPSVVPKDIYRRDEGAKRILAVGRLDHQKGFDLLLLAFARVARKVPQATLTIYGEGPQRQALEAQARSLGISDRVMLAGLSRTPGSWLSDGDIFVLCSRFEGFPNVLLEALAVGIPSVAFDCPWGPGTILRHNETGLLVPAEDVEALATELERILNDEQLRRRLMAAAPAAVERFALPTVMAQWDAVIASAMDR